MDEKFVEINKTIRIPIEGIEFTAIRSGGPGGQHVNKVSTAIQLRFDFENSNLPEAVKIRIRRFKHNSIAKSGIILIKAQQYKSQKKNKDDAVERLITLISSALVKKKKRIPTRPTAGSKKKRLDDKNKHSQKKTLRRKVDE